MQTALVLGGASAVMFLVGIGVSNLFETAGIILLALGFCGILAAGAGFSESLSRVGPVQAEQSASCCGCSCVVALLVIPAGALTLWSAAGPEYALLAVPAWVPLVRLMDAAADVTARTIHRARGV